MRVISLTGASEVTDPATGQMYKAGPDGVFELPESYGHELATRHASVFRRESEHEAALRAAKVEELSNPHILPAVVAELRERLDAAEARIEALEKPAKPARARQSGGKDKAEPPAE